MNWRNWGRFSGVGAQGSTTGLLGGSSRRGQEQESSADVGTPEFEHAGGCWETVAVREAVGVSISHEPTDGNDFGTNPRSMHADRDRNVVVTCRET